MKIAFNSLEKCLPTPRLSQKYLVVAGFFAIVVPFPTTAKRPLQIPTNEGE
jgi:hypothetical protein